MIKTENPVIVEGNIVNIPLESEDNEIRFIIKRNDSKWDELHETSFDDLLTSHTEEWNRLWNISWIDFPEDRAHKIWTRTKYYALSHFPVIPEKPTIPGDSPFRRTFTTLLRIFRASDISTGLKPPWNIGWRFYRK